MLTAMIPPHDTYVEPFVGSGAVFFGKEPSKKEVLNDLSKEVIGTYRLAKQVSSDPADFPNVDTIQKARAFWRGRHTSAEARLTKSIIDFCSGWMSKPVKTESAILRAPPLERRLKNIDDYKERLKGVILRNQDYEKVMREFDSASTFFFCDPPYQETSKGIGYAQQNEFDFERFAKVCKSMKGKVLITINDSPSLREMFKGFTIQPIVIVGTGKKGTKKEMTTIGSKDRKELLISNYALPTEWKDAKPKIVRIGAGKSSENTMPRNLRKGKRGGMERRTPSPPPRDPNARREPPPAPRRRPPALQIPVGDDRLPPPGGDGVREPRVFAPIDFDAPDGGLAFALAQFNVGRPAALQIPPPPPLPQLRRENAVIGRPAVQPPPMAQVGPRPLPPAQMFGPRPPQPQRPRGRFEIEEEKKEAPDEDDMRGGMERGLIGDILDYENRVGRARIPPRITENALNEFADLIQPPGFGRRDYEDEEFEAFELLNREIANWTEGLGREQTTYFQRLAERALIEAQNEVRPQDAMPVPIPLAPRRPEGMDGDDELEEEMAFLDITDDEEEEEDPNESIQSFPTRASAGTSSRAITEPGTPPIESPPPEDDRDGDGVPDRRAFFGRGIKEKTEKQIEQERARAKAFYERKKAARVGEVKKKEPKPKAETPKTKSKKSLKEITGLDDFNYKGELYFVNTGNGRIFEPVGTFDEEVGYDGYTGVGYVGMAYFADMMNDPQYKEIVDAVQKSIKGGSRGGLSVEQMSSFAKSAYSGVTQRSMFGYTLVKGTPTLKFYRRGNHIIVAVRGTQDKKDVDTWIPSIQGKLKDTPRFREDERELDAFQSNFPMGEYRYTGVGHSLAGAIIDIFLRDGKLNNGISFNPMVEPQERGGGTTHRRIYNRNDALWKMFGSKTKGAESFLPSTPVWKAWALYKTPLGLRQILATYDAHTMKTMTGGGEEDIRDAVKTVAAGTDPKTMEGVEQSLRGLAHFYGFRDPATALGFRVVADELYRILPTLKTPKQPMRDSDDKHKKAQKITAFNLLAPKKTRDMNEHTLVTPFDRYDKEITPLMKKFDIMKASTTDPKSPFYGKPKVKKSTKGTYVYSIPPKNEREAELLLQDYPSLKGDTMYYYANTK
jgi:DNA adenine methylase